MSAARPILALLALTSLAVAGCKKGSESGAPLAGGTAIPGASPAAPKKAGLSGKAEVTATNAATLIPHSLGSTWTYTVEIQSQARGTPMNKTTGEVVWEVTALKNEGGAQRFQLTFKNAGKTSDEQTWSYSDKGYFQNTAGSGKRPFDPPQPIVALPAKLGEDYKWSGFVTDAKGRRNKSQLVGQALGYETVDTELGPVEALHVTSVNTFEIQGKDGKTSPARSDTDVWLRPGVGIVRYAQTTRGTAAAVQYTLRLKDFTMK